MFGVGMDDVVDETLYVTDMMAAVTCAKQVREEIYGDDFAVASSLIGVSELGSPDLVIEIKCVAHA